MVVITRYQIQIVRHWQVRDINQGRFQNAYELLNLRAVKIATLYKNDIFQCIFQDILFGISKGIFEIAHKTSYPYIERFDFDTKL